MSIDILILAAGASRRMRGADKLLEPVAGEPLLRRIATQAVEAQDRTQGILRDAGRICVTLPQGSDRLDALNGLPVDVVTVRDAHLGMSRSIRAGVAHLANSTGLMIVPADMPEITAAHMAFVMDAYVRQGRRNITRARSARNIPGHPVVFPPDFFSELAQLSGDKGASEILKRESRNIVYVDLPGDAATTDLDTPEDWEDWRASHE